MERADWLDGAVNSAQARFLMVTAITHHRFSSPVWDEHEVRKLHAELKEIELSTMALVAGLRDGVGAAEDEQDRLPSIAPQTTEGGVDL